MPEQRETKTETNKVVTLAGLKSLVDDDEDAGGWSRGNDDIGQGRARAGRIKSTFFTRTFVRFWLLELLFLDCYFSKLMT